MTKIERVMLSMLKLHSYQYVSSLFNKCELHRMNLELLFVITAGWLHFCEGKKPSFEIDYKVKSNVTKAASIVSIESILCVLVVTGEIMEITNRC